jgi:2-C-methyl-D-erythritol 4-phosphate cytidylyltransferase/2-C-methyl-D-erythritol 2,4-cyclodiphosphate synthase
VTNQHEPDFVGVVVAAGQSTRFGGPIPKQFLDVGGQSVLERSVRALADRPAVAGVVVVLAPEELNGPRLPLVRSWPGVLALAAGGATRADSVLRGLEAAPASRFVLVHDAARPMAPPELVERVIEAARRDGAALPALQVPDTIKEVDHEGAVLRTVDRSALCLAQTPQGARMDWLLDALRGAAADGVEVTDEAAALERAGHRVAVVAGDPRNRKITSEADLDELRRQSTEGEPSLLRVGSGFDVHPFAEGRALVLGGVRFEDEPGLAGHSDADVVLHAAMDALLGAAGLDDIGALFPPDDPQYAGADSGKLASRVARLIVRRGLEVVNLDLTVLAERPRIRPRVAEMRERIAACLEIDSARVGLKATTLEGLGALGRAEGIACQAVALLRGRRGPA